MLIQHYPLAAIDGLGCHCLLWLPLELVPAVDNGGSDWWLRLLLTTVIAVEVDEGCSGCCWTFFLWLNCILQDA